MRNLTVFFAFILLATSNFSTAKADPCFFDEKGNGYCFPYACDDISNLSSKNYSLMRHLKKTKQKSAFSEAKRKCAFKSAGDTTREAADSVIDGGKSFLDKTGVGEFFKSLTK